MKILFQTIQFLEEKKRICTHNNSRLSDRIRIQSNEINQSLNKVEKNKFHSFTHTFNFHSVMAVFQMFHISITKKTNSRMTKKWQNLKLEIIFFLFPFKKNFPFTQCLILMKCHHCEHFKQISNTHRIIIDEYIEEF